MQPRLSRFFCCESLPPSSSELDSTTTDSATDTSTTSTSTTGPTAASQPMTSGPTRIQLVIVLCSMLPFLVKKSVAPFCLDHASLAKEGGTHPLKFFHDTPAFLQQGHTNITTLPIPLVLVDKVV